MLDKNLFELLCRLDSDKTNGEHWPRVTLSTSCPLGLPLPQMTGASGGRLEGDSLSNCSYMTPSN